MRPAAGFEPSETGMTEWGYVWHKLDDTMGQPKVHPLSDWGRLQDYVPPDPYAPGRLEHLPEAIATHQDRFLKFGLGITGFNIVTFLRGFEDFLMDLHLERARVEPSVGPGLGFRERHHRADGRLSRRLRHLWRRLGHAKGADDRP